MKITLEQRAFVVYMLGNIGGGMLVSLILNPLFFGSSSWAYYTVVILSSVVLILLGKMNYDAYCHGLVAGFCKNSRFRQERA